MIRITTEVLNDFFLMRKTAELNRIRKTAGNNQLGFNAFSLMSDIYHRENFHSDILSAILDIEGRHEAGNQYLLLFIQLLNVVHKEFNELIDSNNYKNSVKVTREVGRRDITIYGINNHVVLIENKINDAADTQNQIPSYVINLQSEGKIIDAIVYLTLNQTKQPDQSTWKDYGEKSELIKRKLVLYRAFDGTQKDLCNGWLKKCIDDTVHLDSLSILRQYYAILKHLTQNQMDQEYMSAFYDFLTKDADTREVAKSIKKAVDDLPWYINTRIFNHFANDHKMVMPFHAIKNWRNECYYFEGYKIANCNFHLDIVIPNLEYCYIDFSSREPVYDEKVAKAVLKEIGILDNFNWNGERYVHNFNVNFMEFETEVINFLEKFLKLLIENSHSIEEVLKK